MGKLKSAAALRQQQRARARDEKNNSSNSEVPTPDMRRPSPQSETSDKDSSEEDSASQVQQVRGPQSPNTPKLETLLQELLPDDNIPHLLSPFTRLYEIYPSRGKGLGVFAVTAVPRGTRIIADAPLFSVSGPDARFSNIETEYWNLPAAQQRQYDSLRCPDYPGKSPVIRRWEANCFAMDHNTGIFLLASRINHSCCPNACFRWNATVGRLTVHAIVDIPAGTEVETCYCPPGREVSVRRERLSHYGFNCACEACAVETEAGRERERRRRRMGEVYEKIEGREMYESDFGGKEGEEGNETLELRLELIGLLEDEGFFMKELGDQQRCVARCYMERGGMEKALEYAMLGLRNDVRCFGADSLLVEDAMDFVRLIKG